MGKSCSKCDKHSHFTSKCISAAFHTVRYMEENPPISMRMSNRQVTSVQSDSLLAEIKVED